MDKEKKKTNIKFHIIAIITIIIFCFALTPKTLQNDTFYTITIGKQILNTGIDGVDHYSWHENLPYTYPHWAYDTGMYLIYHLGEISGLPDGGMLFVYISTIVLACVLGILIYCVNNKLTKSKLVSYVITLLAMYLLKPFIAARAQLVTFILFVMTILFIESFLESKKKGYLLGIILISIAIANIHVAVWPFFFVLFLPYVAEYIIAFVAEKHWIEKIKVFNQKDLIKNLETKISKEKDEQKIAKLNEKLEKAKEKLEIERDKLEKAKEKSEKLRKNPYKIQVTKNNAVLWLVLVMVICAITGLLTPLGDTPYTYLVKTMQGTTTKSINEHAPLTLYNDTNTMIMLALYLFMLIFTDTKIKLSDLFMLGGLVFLSFMSRRQISLLIVIGGFVFSKLLASLVEKYDSKGCEKFAEFMTTLIGKICTIAFIVVISFAIYKPKIDNKYINPGAYPIEASDWILENLDVSEIRLYNEYNFGSYLLYRGIPVFIDSRADLYAPEFNGKKNDKGKYEGKDVFSDYINISSLSTYYDTKFNDYGITHVIIKKNSKLNMFISRNEQYKNIYSDNNFVIYERLK